MVRAQIPVLLFFSCFYSSDICSVDLLHISLACWLLELFVLALEYIYIEENTLKYDDILFLKVLIVVLGP